LKKEKRQEELINISEHFDNLIELSKQNNSRFKIIGTESNFVIKAKSDNILIGICSIIILGIPSVLIIKNPYDIFIWLFVILEIVLIISYFKFYPTTNNIEIDIKKRKIHVKSNNLIGRFLIPKIEIDFSKFNKLTSEKIISKNTGMKNFYNRIYIKYDNKTQHLIDFLDGPFYYFNHKEFMNHFAQIIKNEP
jgi:hypothetical protein